MAEPAKVTDADYRNQGKPFDVVLRPFHRIDSPTYDLGQDPSDIPIVKLGKADGLGRDCGCRAPSDLQHGLLSNVLADSAVKGLKALLAVLTGGASAIADEILDKISEGIAKLADKDFKAEFEKWLRDLIATTVEGALLGRLLRAVPAWVPVGRQGYTRKFKYPDTGKVTDREEEREIEGRLDRSYQVSIDQPQFQWSRFHHWSFHVRPLPGHKYLLGGGNGPIHEEVELLQQSQLGTDRFAETVLLHDEDPSVRSLECVMDTGAFSSSPGDQPPNSGPKLPGLMFHPTWPFWPSEGDWFWATGRWAFNCLRGGRASESESDAGKPDLNPTQLNPLKAFACARYDAFLFPENEQPVPAVRFMFFANEQGGYIRFGKDTEIQLRERDYEFIVDLPQLHGDFKRDHPIGRAPAFPLNTIVLRPRLLQDLVFAPYIPKSDFGCPAPDVEFLELDPIVELLPSEDPNAPPKQMKVTVPLSKLPEGKAGGEGKAYGFVLTLGWYDPAQSEAARVARLTLVPKRMQFKNGAENLRVKFSLNSRWFGFFTGGSQSDDFAPPLQPFTVHLPDDATLHLSVHGTRRHGYGEYMEERPRNNTPARTGRTLRMGGLINVDKATRKTIEDLIKAGKEIPSDFTVIGQVLNNEFAKILLDNAPELLFGERKDVVWTKDVDNEEGKDVKNLKASEVARELFVDPLPFINLPDEPIGWLSTTSHGLVGSQGSSVRTSPGLAFENPVRDLLKALDEQKVTTHSVTGEADRVVPIGTGSNLAVQINAIETLFGHRERLDYTLSADLHVARVAPAPKPAPEPETT